MDVLARRGVPGYASSWPFVPGMEVGGEVVALGEGVSGFAVGDTVVALTVDGGGLAETVVAEAGLAARVPAASRWTPPPPCRSPGPPRSV